MFDTMTFTKILGGFCGAFLVYLLIGWGAEGLYHTGGDAHGGESHDAYPIEVADGGDHGEVEEGPSFAELLAVADAGKGERVFKKCTACHNVEGSNGTGPYLNGVVGRDIASAPGFGYSGTLQGLEGSWTPEALNAFVESPKGYAPGTSMSFNGLKKIEDRADLIAFLQSVAN